jgi:hypothetical protein
VDATEDGHSAEARVRAIPDYGLELRFSIDNELYYSHRFTAWEPLEQAAREKRGVRAERLVGGYFFNRRSLAPAHLMHTRKQKRRRMSPTPTL